MKSLRRFLTRLRNLATGPRNDDRIREEIEAHIAAQTNENIRSGISPNEARRQAVLKFGAVEAVKEEYRGERRILFVENLAQDIRFGMRTLRKSPGFTAVAVLTIALGIGATTAIFSVVDATLLHRLPFPHPERLVRIQDDLPGVGAQDVGMSQPEWQDLAAFRNFRECVADRLRRQQCGGIFSAVASELTDRLAELFFSC